MLVADHFTSDTMMISGGTAAHRTFFRHARLAPVRGPQKNMLQLPLGGLELRQRRLVDVAHDPPARLGPRARDTQTSTHNINCFSYFFFERPGAIFYHMERVVADPGPREPSVERDGLRSRFLRGASLSLDSVRTASKSKDKPPTTSSDGHESHRWREGVTAPRDAEIMPSGPCCSPTCKTVRRRSPP